MANNIYAITKYLPKIIDTGFCDDSFIKQWFVNSNKYVELDFKESGYVRIMEIALDGLSDYYRVNHAGVANADYANYNGQNGTGARDGLQRGNVQSRWATYGLKHERGKQIPIDYIDNEVAGGRLITVTFDEFVRTQYVPEFDTIGFSTLAGRTYTTYGNQVSADYDTNPNKIIAGFDDGIAWLKQHGVRESDIVIFVDPITMNLIRHTTELTHFVTPADFMSQVGVSFKLMSYNGMPIVEVPSDRFYTNAVTSANGVLPTTNSKRINFLVCDTKCMVPVVKLEWNQIFGNENGVTDFKGWLIDTLNWYDFIIPNKKVPGVYCSVSSSNAGSAITNVLNVALVAGDVSGTTAVMACDTVPTSKAGTLVYSATAMVLGTTYTIDGSTIVAVPLSSETGYYAQFAPSVTANAYYALLDSNGLCIAVAPVIASVPVHA